MEKSKSENFPAAVLKGMRDSFRFLIFGAEARRMGKVVGGAEPSKNKRAGGKTC